MGYYELDKYWKVPYIQHKRGTSMLQDPSYARRMAYTLNLLISMTEHSMHLVQKLWHQLPDSIKMLANLSGF